MVVQGFMKSQEDVLAELKMLIQEYFELKGKEGIINKIQFGRKRNAIDSRLKYLSKFYKKG